MTRALVTLPVAIVLCAAAAGQVAMPHIGDPAPPFSAQNQDGQVRTLADFRGRTLIIAFYPKDFTAG